MTAMIEIKDVHKFFGDLHVLKGAHRKNECILVRNPPVSSSALVM